MAYKTPEKKRAYNYQYWQEHKEQYKVYRQRYRQSHLEEERQRDRDYWRVNGRNKKYWARIRFEVLAYYSIGNKPKCTHCGESDIKVLCIDHINNDGNQQRKQLNLGGMGFYRWLKSQGYPKGYQVLCWNCNARKEFDRRANI